MSFVRRSMEISDLLGCAKNKPCFLALRPNCRNCDWECSVQETICAWKRGGLDCPPGPNGPIAHWLSPREDVPKHSRSNFLKAGDAKWYHSHTSFADRPDLLVQGWRQYEMFLFLTDYKLSTFEYCITVWFIFFHVWHRNTIGSKTILVLPTGDIDKCQERPYHNREKRWSHDEKISQSVFQSWSAYSANQTHLPTLTK